MSWSGPGIVAQQGGTAYATSAGWYTAHGILVDSTGCSHDDHGQILVSFPPDPELDVFPTDGIICPDSTAIIFTDAVGQHSWYGPNGLEASINDSIWVNTPGDYYLQTIDAMGCVLDSDPVLVTGYATPFLNVLPDAVLCIGEGPVTLQVVSTNYSSLVWDAPLNGNAPIQTVSQPGTYSCSVTACGIVTELQTVVVQGSAVADLLTPGPFVICPGDTALLEAAPGQVFYIWEPGGQFGSTLAATAEGSYQVIVMDPNGCSDTSLVVTVDVVEFSDPLSSSSATVCPGDSILLNVPGSGQLTWYSDAQLTDSIANGPQLQLPALFADTTLYIAQSENGCSSIGTLVEVVVAQTTQPPVLSGTDTACVGSTVQLSAGGIPGATFIWETPNGPFTGSALMLDPVQFSDAGMYIVVAIVGACSSPPDTFQLAVVEPAVIDLGPDLSACSGDVLALGIPAGFSMPQWSPGGTSDTLWVTVNGQIMLEALDSNGCSVSDDVLVTFTEPTLPLVTTDAEVCLGLDAVLSGNGSGTITWTSDMAGLDTLGGGSELLIVQPIGDLTVYAWQSTGACSWGPYPVTAFVSLPPDTVEASGPAFVCVGEDVEITLNTAPGVGVEWDTPNGPLSGMPLWLTDVQPGDAGVYTAHTSMNGCIGDSATWSLTVFVPAPLDLGPDTTFCTGGMFTVELPDGFSDPLWSDASTGNSITTGVSGYFSVHATDTNGCVVSDGVLLLVIECGDGVPNTITPNGDGVNDQWLLGPTGNIGARLVVFDRFGDEVYNADPRTRPFNGVHQMSGEALSDGVYFYVLGLERYGGAFDEVKGYIHLTH